MQLTRPKQTWVFVMMVLIVASSLTLLASEVFSFRQRAQQLADSETRIAEREDQIEQITAHLAVREK
jgi:hypothetical protein